MRVLVAPDKFKGNLTAAEVATAIGSGLAHVGVASTRLPLADGGDGSVAAAVAGGFTTYPVTVRGADGHPVAAEVAFDGHTAVVEVANTCGMSTLPDGQMLPMAASSYGFGQAVRSAVGLGAKRVVLALGGSASTDGGAGMLAALGARFHDRNGHEVMPSGGILGRLATVDISGLLDVAEIEFVVATDVDNPLLHDNGAAAVFGPQKGATELDVLHLEAGLDHFVRLLETAAPPSASATGGGVMGMADEPGAGAAGGLGFTCRWLGASRVAGADFFLDLLRFDDHLTSCTAVITGEGRIDGQTLSGKLPAVVAARADGRPVHVMVGRNDLTTEEARRLKVETVTDLASLTSDDPNGNSALSVDLLRDASAALGRRIRSGHRLVTR